jgi:hypothetical protein
MEAIDLERNSSSGEEDGAGGAASYLGQWLAKIRFSLCWVVSGVQEGISENQRYKYQTKICIASANLFFRELGAPRKMASLIPGATKRDVTAFFYAQGLSRDENVRA